MDRKAAVAALLTLAGCQAALRSARPPPLEETGESEVAVYLSPAADGQGGLAVSFESVALQTADGQTVPLSLAAPDMASGGPFQRLLATGRVPPADYAAVLVGLRKASVGAAGDRADLLLPQGALQAPVNFRAPRGRAVVLLLELDRSRAAGRQFAAPELNAAVARRPVPPVSGFVAVRGGDAVALFDRRTREVLGLYSTGRDPVAVAADQRALRLYVALGGADVVQILDLASADVLMRARLLPGDRPADMALTPDGRTLVIVNRGSNTASFVDAASGVESGRAPIGADVHSVLLDRSGRRAYAFNRGSSTITVLDVVNRSVVRTVSTDPEPMRGAFNRAGDRLYVAAAGSPNLTVLSLPDMVVQRRIWIGLGATAVEVDPVTDIVYVAKRNDPALQGFDPFSFLAVDTLVLPAPTIFMAIDEVERTLFAVAPDADVVDVVDLGSRKTVGRLEVGADPRQLVLMGARR